MRVFAGRCLLRERLEEVGMTQTELANKLGLTKQQINKYLRVKNRVVMSLQTAVNIACIIGCDVKDLYEWIPDEAGRKE